MIIGSGQFEGRGGHEMSGSFTIEKIDGKVWMITSEDFYFDGSPSPGFAISRSGSPSATEAEATDFLRLPGTGKATGDQIEVTGIYRGEIPSMIDIEVAKTLFLWCFEYPFLLGVGQIDHVD